VAAFERDQGHGARLSALMAAKRVLRRHSTGTGGDRGDDVCVFGFNEEGVMLRRAFLILARETKKLAASAMKTYGGGSFGGGGSGSGSGSGSGVNAESEHLSRLVCQHIDEVTKTLYTLGGAAEKSSVLHHVLRKAVEGGGMEALCSAAQAATEALLRASLGHVNTLALALTTRAHHMLAQSIQYLVFAFKWVNNYFTDVCRIFAKRDDDAPMIVIRVAEASARAQETVGRRGLVQI
jgi:hypothetical protein